MPSSLGKDNNDLPNGNSQNNKPTQKITAGVQIPTKNGRKSGTAKDGGGGGILAAVAKNASRNSAKAPTPPSSVQSPEMRPTVSPENGNMNIRASSLLGAPAASSESHATSEWTRTVSSFSSSPNNLISLGESPPILPSSYEDRAVGGWTTRDQRTYHHGHPQSASPPTRSRRPLSYQGSDDHLGTPPYGIRRSSLYAQHPQNLRYGNQPPLPHQPQAHFYGAPDVNLLLSPRAPGLTPGENGLYCGFDNLPTSFQTSSKTVDNALVVGYEGGFTIYSIARGGLNRITDIRGLRGGVYHAKILPWSIRDSQEALCPLIALVVHGRVSLSAEEGADESATTPSEAISRAEATRGLPQVPGLLPHENEEFQTSVEIYSLSTKEHIATLLSISKTDTSSLAGHPSLNTPAGALSIRADTGTIIVTSGITGETWIFRHEDFKAVSGGKFRCIGKVWTTVQHGLSVDSTSSPGNIDGDWHTSEQSPRQLLYKASILSLAGRWLAYCPAAASSQISLRATVLAATLTSRPPGLNAHAPPQLPVVNCAVETPGGESIVKQLAQLATQEFIKGATYVGKQGVQAWNNWWNPPTASQQNGGGGVYQAHGTAPQQFPPTHGNTSQVPAIKDPGLVSILDLDSLSHQSSSSASIHPLATFKIPHGCSFLSFSPGGLMLFTASSKGDVQFVWDLKRMQYAKSSLLKVGLQSSAVQGPHVRQVAQFSRMTIARIVDVVWTSPHGERAAMVTEPGTVHVLDIPASAFTWPAPRRKLPVPKPEDSVGDTAGPGLSAVSVASNAVTSIWTAARPLVSRPRRSSAGISGISASVTSQAGHGTHALAAGISRSVGAATGKMNEMRKASGNKVYVPRSLTFPTLGCVRLSGGKRSDSIHVVGDGVIRIYTIKSRQADRPTDKQKASRSSKYVEFRIPQLPDFKMIPDLAFAGGFEVDSDVEEGDRKPPRWTGRAGAQHTTLRKPVVESSIPQAEIESNAPYQPFHTDRRVGLYIYSAHEDPIHEDPIPSPSVSALLSPISQTNAPRTSLLNNNSAPWAFGGPIKAIRLNVGPPQGNDDDYDSGADHRALPSSAIERVMRMTDGNEDMDQIVITTRKRRGAARIGSDGTGDGDEEGFFEDDCEVLDFASQRV
ncbi:hypothetical protein B7463_g1508, partial [Scytalidium lignicola]